MAKSRPAHEFLEPEEWESWCALMLLHRSVLRELDDGLRREHGLAVTEFDVLITLYNAPDNRLRMSVLAERVLVPGAAISGFIRPLPSAVTGPRLLKEAAVSVPVFSAPTV